MALATTRFDVAAPFLASSLLLFLAPFAVLAIELRLSSVYREWAENLTVKSTAPDQHQHPPLIFDPEQMAQTAIWAIDASQILSIFFGPIAGLLILHPRISSGVALLYIAAIVVSIAGFLGFTFKVRPDRYGRTGFSIFTHVSILGIVATLAAAGVAAAIGP